MKEIDCEAIEINQFQELLTADFQAPDKGTPSTMSKVTTFFTPPWMRDKKAEDKTTVAETNAKPPEFPSAARETTTKKLPPPIK